MPGGWSRNEMHCERNMSHRNQHRTAARHPSEEVATVSGRQVRIKGQVVSKPSMAKPPMIDVMMAMPMPAIHWMFALSRLALSSPVRQCRSCIRLDGYSCVPPARRAAGRVRDCPVPAHATMIGRRRSQLKDTIRIDQEAISWVRPVSSTFPACRPPTGGPFQSRLQNRCLPALSCKGS